MKKQVFLYVAAVLLFSVSCEKEAMVYEPQDAQFHLKTDAEKGQKVISFKAHLTGDQENDPVETNATGQAVFKLSKDGTELHYKLIVANIENVVMAHIHNAPPEENGGVVVWLYPDGPPPSLIPGRTDGVLAQGVITEGDLVGSLKDKDFDELINLMASGLTYVNVHTSQHPGGEIRGQIYPNNIK